MTQVVVALGSNLGDREGRIGEAIARLSEWVQEVRISRLYRTAPLYLEDQPEFLNACLIGRTSFGPLRLLRALKAIELALGRRPRGRNEPREIDLDLVAYGRLVFRQAPGLPPGLTVPHPRAGERRFVLEPLFELEPEFVLPDQGAVRELLSRDSVSRQPLEVHGVARIPL